MNLKYGVHQFTIPYHSAIWDGIFKKYQYPTILDKTAKANWKTYFSAKKIFSPHMNVACRVPGFLLQNLVRFNIYIVAWGGKYEFWKFKSTLEFPGFLTVFSKSFVQDCSKFLYIDCKHPYMPVFSSYTELY